MTYKIVLVHAHVTFDKVGASISRELFYTFVKNAWNVYRILHGQNGTKHTKQMYNMTIQIGHGLPFEDNNTDAHVLCSH